MNRLISELFGIMNSQKIILRYNTLIAEKNKVNLNWYQLPYEICTSDSLNAGQNLGDYLSKLIFEYMLEVNNIENKTTKTKHLYAVGSILLMGYQNATVWGTGFPFEPGTLRGMPHRKPFRKLDVRCVRGPLTRKTLLKLGHECPENYGDPAVLMPLIYNPESTDKGNDFVIIPHYSTEESTIKQYGKDKVISMRTTDYKSVIDKIVKAERVVSSSLHGIILAEAYGVPAVFYHDRPVRFDYKYEDWYLSTEREFRPYDTLEEAIKARADFVPDLTKLKKTLINTFPLDLWNK